MTAPSQSLGRDQVEKIVRTFLATYAAKDVDTRAALFTDDAIFEDPVGSEPVRGKSNIIAFFQSTIASGWEIALEAQSIIKSGSEALAITRATLGAVGQPPAKVILAQNFVFDASGKIARLRIFFDEPRAA